MKKIELKTGQGSVDSAGRSEEQTRILKSIFGDMRVVEGRASIIIYANPEDVAGAVRNSICNCVFARASRRLYGSRAVVFFKSVAYVDLANEHGVREVNRFAVTPAMSARIVHFDKTGEAHPGGFVLQAPPKSKQLDYQRKSSSILRSKPGSLRKRRAQRKRWNKSRKSVIMGYVKNFEVAKTPEGPIGYVRNGSGMAHFITQSTSIKKRATK